MKKNLIHFFAVVGFGTFILLACSVDDVADSMDNNNNSEIVSNNYGKYQITGTGNQFVFHVLDTETGVVKTYTAEASANWITGGSSYELLYTTQTN